MLKKVRKRPKHNTSLKRPKGVIYLPRPWIGTNVQILTEGQYNRLITSVKQLKRKIARIRGLIYHEYSRT